MNDIAGPAQEIVDPGLVRSAKNEEGNRIARREPANQLSLITTSYGRLVFLAGLRNPNTGQYEYYGCPEYASRYSVSQALSRIHEEIFREWVSYSLERKKADIDTYINGLDIDHAELVGLVDRHPPVWRFSDMVISREMSCAIRTSHRGRTGATRNPLRLPFLTTGEVRSTDQSSVSR